jgi:hypothetical protein
MLKKQSLAAVLIVVTNMSSEIEIELGAIELPNRAAATRLERINCPNLL